MPWPGDTDARALSRCETNGLQEALPKAVGRSPSQTHPDPPPSP